MRTPNHVWIKYPRTLEDKLTHGGLTIDFVPDFSPEWHSVLHGEVYSFPETNDFGIQDKLQEGDKIYFHYLSADEENTIEQDVWETITSYGMQISQKTKKRFLRIPMNRIFCYVREGKITAYGGHVLAKAVFEDDVEQVEVDGKMIPAKLSKSGLVTDLDISFTENTSVIHYIGLPVEWEEDLGLKKGDKVLMDKMSHHKNTIEGVEYFVFQQEDIMAVVDV